MDINKAIEVYNKLKKNDLVQQYEEAFSIIIDYYHNNTPKRTFYKKAKGYKYYIEHPYKKLSPSKDGFIWEDYSYNVIFINENENICEVRCPGNFCLGKCNLSLKEIQQVIDKHINKGGSNNE